MLWQMGNNKAPTILQMSLQRCQKNLWLRTRSWQKEQFVKHFRSTILCGVDVNVKIMGAQRHGHTKASQCLQWYCTSSGVFAGLKRILYTLAYRIYIYISWRSCCSLEKLRLIGCADFQCTDGCIIYLSVPSRMTFHLTSYVATNLNWIKPWEKMVLMQSAFARLCN